MGVRLFVDGVVLLDVGGAAADEDYDVAEFDMGAWLKRRGRIQSTSSGRMGSRSRIVVKVGGRGTRELNRRGEWEG